MTEFLNQAEDFVHFLDDLRASGRTNMFGAGPYLREEFGLTRDESHLVLSTWIKLDRTLPIAERTAAMRAAMTSAKGAT